MVKSTTEGEHDELGYQAAEYHWEAHDEEATAHSEAAIAVDLPSKGWSNHLHLNLFRKNLYLQAS
jgi:hypothetical protein